MTTRTPTHPLLTLLLGLALASPLAGCHAQSASSAVKDEVDGGDNGFRYSLGTAYNSLVGVFGDGACVTGQQVPVYRPSAELNAGADEEEKETSYSLTMSGDAHGLVSGLNVSGHVQLETTLGTSSLSKQYVLTFKYTAGNVVLTDPALSPLGASVGTLDPPHPLARLQTCGDEYLYQVELGGKLHAGVEYTFGSEEMKNKFSASVSAKDPTGTFKVTYELPSANAAALAIHGMARLVFDQEGGDLQAYRAVAQSLPPDCLTGKVIATVETTLDDAEHTKAMKLQGFEDCVQAYEATVLPYARDAFRQQIATLKYMPGTPFDRSGLEVLRFFTKPYLSSGFVGYQQDLLIPPTLRALASDLKAVAAQVRTALQLLASYKKMVNLPVASGNVFDATGVDRGQVLALTTQFDDFGNLATQDVTACMDQITAAAVGRSSVDSATQLCQQHLASLRTALQTFDGVRAKLGEQGH